MDNEKQIIAWNDISNSASDIFNIWVDQPEMKWAEKAWDALTKAGLTGCSDEIERHKSLIRLMTLGVMYAEFCCKAWEECGEPPLTDWADTSGINPLRIGQLLGADFEPEIVDEFDFLETALKRLIDNSRQEVFEALCKYFQYESMLFLSLWITNSGDWDENNPEESISDILNNIDGEFGKMEAFSWVAEGMPPVAWWL